jgi:cold shock CspA family protein
MTHQNLACQKAECHAWPSKMLRPPDQTEQYRNELYKALSRLGSISRFMAKDIRAVTWQLSTSSPYRESLSDSLKLLRLVDERMRPLPALTALWQNAHGAVVPQAPSPPPLSGQLRGKVVKLKKDDGFGFIRSNQGTDFFFHVSSLVSRSDWDTLRVGAAVSFEDSGRSVPGKSRAARSVRLTAGSR